MEVGEAVGFSPSLKPITITTCRLQFHHHQMLLGTLGTCVLRRLLG